MRGSVRIRWLLPALLVLASCGFGPDNGRCENHSCPAVAPPQVTTTLRLNGQLFHVTGRRGPLAGGRTYAISVVVSVPPDAKVSSYALAEADFSSGSAGGKLVGQRVLRKGQSLVDGQVLKLDWGPLKSGIRSLVLNYREDEGEIATSVGDFIVS